MWQIQELLGHASISTTQRYTAVGGARLVAVYEKARPGAWLERPQARWRGRSMTAPPVARKGGLHPWVRLTGAGLVGCKTRSGELLFNRMKRNTPAATTISGRDW